MAARHEDCFHGPLAFAARVADQRPDIIFSNADIAAATRSLTMCGLVAKAAAISSWLQPPRERVRVGIR